MAVADYQGETMELLEVFGGKGELLPLAEYLAAPETRTVVLGFAPETAEGWKQAPLREEDTTLFVWKGGRGSFYGGGSPVSRPVPCMKRDHPWRKIRKDGLYI